MSEDKPQHNPQQYSWKVVKKYDDYKLADVHRTSLTDKGQKVKVSRRGIGGYAFAVKVGTLVKKEEEKTDEGS